MVTWEYVIVALPEFQSPTAVPGGSAAVAALNREGEAGWEAVGMTSLADGTFTALLVVGPVFVLAACVPLLWGRLLTFRDVALATGLYLVTGHGITVGYHRLFTHRSFKATRPLKITLAVAGSMAVEGSVIGWV